LLARAPQLDEKKTDAICRGFDQSPFSAAFAYEAGTVIRASIVMRPFNRSTESDRGRTYYGLILLTAIYGFNFVDSQALGLVLQNIKGAYHVSDTALGLLTGIAFTFFYATFGIPIGRWADRGNRVTIITLALGLKSLLVMLSGAAQTFAVFLVARMGIAVGEAGSVPPAFSLISDYFPRAQRPRALAIYYVGGQGVASVVGFLAGGWLSRIVGWRMMFAILGAPGLVLMIIAWFTLKEPRLAGADQQRESPPTPDQPSLIETGRSLLKNRTFRHVAAMLCVLTFFGGGAGNWQPTFFIRSFGLTTTKVGTWFALLSLGGAISGYCGGYLASRFAPENEPLQLRCMAGLCVGYGGMVAMAYLSHTAIVSLTLTAIASVGLGAYGGPLMATSQTAVPEHVRAISISLLFLLTNLVGSGLGPLVVGALSDAWRQTLGDESLRYALLATCPGFLWCAWHLWRAAQYVLTDIARVNEQRKPPAVSCLAVEAGPCR
jgi:MFS family permease